MSQYYECRHAKGTICKVCTKGTPVGVSIDTNQLDTLREILQQFCFDVVDNRAEYDRSGKDAYNDYLAKAKAQLNNYIADKILELIGEDERDEPKDAYSQTAIYKDYRNNLRAELRDKANQLREEK